MITLLYAGKPENWSEYQRYIPAALKAKGIDVKITQDCDAKDVDYIVYSPASTVQDFTSFTKLKAVLSLWAGVERITGNKTLKVPLCRMVDAGLREGMSEWVTGHVLRHHLGMDGHIVNPEKTWNHNPPPLARQRNIGILGLGELGQACAESLKFMNFNVMGWSRTLKKINEVTCFSGKSGLNNILKKSEILVLLLPQTPETHHVLNAKNLAKLPRGAIILNPGRGPLIDDKALLNSLNSGQIAHATLDVFTTEPLPEDHPYWAHPNVTVTPHIASDTRTITAADVIATNVERCENGQELLFQVDRSLSY